MLKRFKTVNQANVGLFDENINQNTRCDTASLSN